MNEVIKNIQNRRSVRFFEDKPISKDILETLIQAGNLAPTGANRQPWRFVGITDPATRKMLSEKALPRYQAWLSKADEAMKERRKAVDSLVADPVYYNAPAVIFVVGIGPFAALDCPMACENIMLAARSLGLGSCWVFFGQLVIDDQEVQKLLELKEGEKVYGPLVVGYPKDGFPPTPPKKDAVVKWI